jgi:hypothetical protein
MIFRLYEHYEDNYIEYNECFICYDVDDDLKSKPIKLKSQINYTKQCSCDGWIHQGCLDSWYTKQKKCPICRCKITKINTDKKVNLITIVVQCSKTFEIYLSIALHRMSKMTMYILLFYILIEYYLYCATKKHLLKEEHI